MLETGAVQSQDGASGSPDGERLSPASNEESQTHQRGQQQLVAVHVCVHTGQTLATGGQQSAWRGPAPSDKKFSIGEWYVWRELSLHLGIRLYNQWHLLLKNSVLYYSVHTNFRIRKSQVKKKTLQKFRILLMFCGSLPVYYFFVSARSADHHGKVKR